MAAIEKKECAEKSSKNDTTTYQTDAIPLPVKEVVQNQFPVTNDLVRMTIQGASNTGKSYLLLHLIPCFTRLSNIIVCSKIVGLDIYDSIAEYCKKNKINYQFAEEPFKAAAAIEEAIAKRPEGTFSLIILDDFSSMKSSSRSDPYNRLTEMTSCMLRNMGCSCIFVTQDTQRVPTVHRDNCNMYVTFKLGNHYALRNTMDMLSAMSDVPKQEILKAYNRVVLKIPHSYLIYTRNRIFCYNNNTHKFEGPLPTSDEAESSSAPPGLAFSAPFGLAFSAPHFGFDEEQELSASSDGSVEDSLDPLDERALNASIWPQESMSIPETSFWDRPKNTIDESLSMGGYWAPADTGRRLAKARSYGARSEDMLDKVLLKYTRGGLTRGQVMQYINDYARANRISPMAIREYAKKKFFVRI